MSSSAEQAAARAVDSASFLVGQLKSAQLDVLDRAPAEVKATQWYRDFRKSVQDMDTTGWWGMRCAVLCTWLLNSNTS